eukprot:2053937-Pyramimonas_sp.AAC.4
MAHTLGALAPNVVRITQERAMNTRRVSARKLQAPKRSTAYNPLHTGLATGRNKRALHVTRVSLDDIRFNMPVNMAVATTADLGVDVGSLDLEIVQEYLQDPKCANPPLN